MSVLDVQDALEVVRDVIEDEDDPEATAAFKAIERHIQGFTANHGEKLPFRYGDGKRARVGDKVKFTGSARYGSGTGTTIGDAGDESGKQRVTIKLDNGANNAYTPSVGRVSRVEKAQAAE